MKEQEVPMASGEAASNSTEKDSWGQGAGLGAPIKVQQASFGKKKVGQNNTVGGGFDNES